MGPQTGQTPSISLPILRLFPIKMLKHTFSVLENNPAILEPTGAQQCWGPLRFLVFHHVPSVLVPVCSELRIQEALLVQKFLHRMSAADSS